MSEPTHTPATPAPPAAPATGGAPTAPPPAPPGGLVIPATIDPRSGDVAPAAPAPATDPSGVWSGDVTPAPGVTTVPAPTSQPAPAAPPANGQPYVEIEGRRYYTEDYLEQARTQERDKMHQRLETLEQRIAREDAEREAEIERQRQEAAQQAAEDERTRLSGLPVEERIQEMQQTWERKWAERDERDRAREALEEQERRFTEVLNYKQRRIAEESDLIHPTLRDLVTGATPEEVEQSITDLKARTDAIVGTMRDAAVAQRQVMPGVAPTGAPPVGPLDQSSGYQSITSADIAAMDPATYAKNRPALMEALRRKTQTEGLYGS